MLNFMPFTIKNRNKTTQETLKILLQAMFYFLGRVWYIICKKIVSFF